MTDYLYQQRYQKIYLIPESSYGTPLNGSAWTGVGSDWLNFRRLNIIPEGVDIPPPFILKEKFYDIDASKHPTDIVSTNIEPEDFTIELQCQHPIFLAYAVGKVSSTVDDVSEVNKITCPAKASITGADYFSFYAINSSGVISKYYVWFDVSGSDSDPACGSGHTACEVDISAVSTATEVAAAVAAVMNAKADMTATSTLAVVTATMEQKGALPTMKGNNSNFAFEVTTAGLSTYTIQESLDAELPSFTLHCEQKNTTATESIAYEMMGCVVTEYKLAMSRDNKIMKETVSIRCPYADFANAGVFNAEEFQDKVSPFTWNTLQSTPNILEENSASVAPSIIKSIDFTVSNDLELLPELTKRQLTQQNARKREIKMDISGFIKKKTLLDFWKDTWDISDEFYTNATTRISSEIKLQRSATDYFSIGVYNWLIDKHSAHFVNIDEGIKGVDLSFSDAIGNSDGRCISTFTIKTRVSDIFLPS